MDTTKPPKTFAERIAELIAALREADATITRQIELLWMAGGRGLECPTCGFATNRMDQLYCDNDGAALVVVTWKDRALSAAAKIQEWTQRAEKAEARLAQAQEALRAIEREIADDDNDRNALGSCVRVLAMVRAALPAEPPAPVERAPAEPWIWHVEDLRHGVSGRSLCGTASGSFGVEHESNCAACLRTAFAESQTELAACRAQVEAAKRRLAGAMRSQDEYYESAKAARREVNGWKAQAEQAEAERDALRAQVARFKQERDLTRADAEARLTDDVLKDALSANAGVACSCHLDRAAVRR